MKSVLNICLLLSSMIFSVDGLTDQSDEKRAAAAFGKGISLYKAGKMDEAVKAFRRADALNPSWKIQYNIGQCEASLKRYGLAIEAFEHYLGKGGDDIPIERRDAVLKELDRLRRMVGTIIIKGEPGVDVYVDIVKYGNTAKRSSIKVTAGVEHEVSFVKDGKKIGSVTLRVSGGEILEVPLDSKAASVGKPTLLPPAAVSPAPPTVSAPPPAATAAKEPPYKTMRQLKEALRKRVITRQDYARHQAEIRRMLNAEYAALKQALRAGKLTKREYKIKAAEAKRKYEGK